MGAPNLVPTPNTHDPNSIIRAIMRLSSLALGSGSTPTFASLTLSGLTANRLIYTNGDNKLTSVSSLSSWVSGTTDEITVADDGDGTITLSLAAGASGTLDHNDLINTHNLTTDIDHDSLTNFVANEHIDWTGATQDFLTSGSGTINGLVPGADDMYDLGKEELLGGGGSELKISQATYGGLEEFITDTSLRGNSFTPDEDMSVIKIVVRMRRYGTPTTATLYLSETVSGTPSGVPLASKTVDVSAISSDLGGELVEFTFDSSVNLTSGTMYAWYGDSAVGGVRLVGSSSNQYADGTHIWTNDGGATWGTTAGWEHVFYIYTETFSTEYTRWQDLYLSGSLKDGTNSLTIANLQSAYDHIHNLTTDIDHDALTNFVANEHIDWTSTSSSLSTSGSLTAVAVNLPTTSGANTGVIKQNSGRFLHTYGTNNFFLGADAGNFTITGDNNACIGSSSGLGLTTASFNTAIGRNTLYATTGGGYNIAIGGLAMRYNTTGYDNTAIGPYALFENTTGYRNIGVGRSAVFGSDTGFSNIGVGDFSLRYCASGQFNIGIGRMALFNVISGVQSSAVGAEAGYSSTGSRNIFLGYNAGYRQTTADDLLIIDNRQRASAAAELTDALLVGTMAAAPSSQSLSINAEVVTLAYLPVSDPGVAGQLWNSSGTVMVSLGP